MNETDRDVKEDARVGYRAALDLLNAGASQTWMRFNAMLVANSIIVAILGQLLKENDIIPLPYYALLLLPGAGLVLCIAWGAAISRGMQYQDRYVSSAREIEEKHLAPTVTIMVDGQRLQMKGLARVRTRIAMWMVVWPFVILHLAGAMLVWYRLSEWGLSAQK